MATARCDDFSSARAGAFDEFEGERDGIVVLRGAGVALGVLVGAAVAAEHAARRAIPVSASVGLRRWHALLFVNAPCNRRQPVFEPHE